MSYRYWAYQHVNKHINVKQWFPPINGECDRCIAIRDARQPGAMVDAVFPVAHAFNGLQYHKWVIYTFIEHKLDKEARFAAILDEC